jgi:hypothetical protein
LLLLLLLLLLLPAVCMYQVTDVEKGVHVIETGKTDAAKLLVQVRAGSSRDSTQHLHTMLIVCSTLS